MVKGFFGIRLIEQYLEMFDPNKTRTKVFTIIRHPCERIGNLFKFLTNDGGYSLTKCDRLANFGLPTDHSKYNLIFCFYFKFCFHIQCISFVRIFLGSREYLILEFFYSTGQSIYGFCAVTNSPFVIGEIYSVTNVYLIVCQSVHK